MRLTYPKILDSIASFIRWSEWYDSKIPPIVGWLYYAIYKNGDFVQKWPFIKVVFFAVLFMAYGYVLNDYSDIEIDKKAGKKKIIANLPRNRAKIIITAIFLLGLFSLYSYYSQLIVVISVLGAYILATSYSLLPFRLKEKGAWGVVVASAAQRISPIVVGMSVLGLYDLVSVLWLLFNFGIGIRYILIHQYKDIENDIRTGVDTFVIQHSIATLHRLILVSLVIEFFLAMWIGMEIKIPLFALIGMMICVVLRTLTAVFLERNDVLHSFTYVPLTEFIIIFFPSTLLFFLIHHNISSILFAIIEVIWKYSFIKRYFLPICIFVRSYWRNQHGG